MKEDWKVTPEQIADLRIAEVMNDKVISMAKAVMPIRSNKGLDRVHPYAYMKNGTMGITAAGIEELYDYSLRHCRDYLDIELSKPIPEIFDFGAAKKVQMHMSGTEKITGRYSEAWATDDALTDFGPNTALTKVRRRVLQRLIPHEIQIRMMIESLHITDKEMQDITVSSGDEKDVELIAKKKAKEGVNQKLLQEWQKMMATKVSWEEQEEYVREICRSEGTHNKLTCNMLVQQFNHGRQLHGMQPITI